MNRKKSVLGPLRSIKPVYGLLNLAAKGIIVIIYKMIKTTVKTV